MKHVTDWLMGRSTSFAVAFFVSGNLMHAFHRLDATYIAFMGTLLGAVIGHSFKEDYADKQSAAV